MSAKDLYFNSDKETEKTVPHAWLFDVDGVLTHPVEKKVTEEEVINSICNMLARGEPVSLNTGRSIDFMTERVLNKLEALIVDRNLLKNMLAVGEKGSVWISYDETGNKLQSVDQSVTVPVVIREEVKRLVKDKFNDAMFYDETKKTMVSVEMRDGYDWEGFRRAQIKLDKELLKILERHNLTGGLKIDPSRIATDVENKHVGKALGARRFLDWLGKKKIATRKFVAFGDSRSDVGMAEEIHGQGKPVEFVFVGGKDLLRGREFNFPVVYTAEHCEKGTLEYLKSIIT
jgi:hydroxymethylpyrimidine pyrophosphatase-like HAD family hydrolase